MRYASRIAATTLLLLLAAASSGATQSVPASPPQGLRIFTTGHSFHVFVPPLLEELAERAGIHGHEQVGLQGIGGSRVLQHWNVDDSAVPDSVATAKRELTKGSVDVFTMSPVVSVPDEGIARFAELGLAHNPRLRLIVQASWIPGEQSLPVDEPDRNRWLASNSLRDSTRVAALWPAIDSFRSRIEAQVDQLNRRYGRTVLTIVPVGNAVLRLREMVEAGSFPGVAKPSQLFTDAVGHGRNQILALTAYCNFAAIYGRSPLGLDLSLADVTAEQHRILQQLAWETVSHYPYSGIQAGDPRSASAEGP